MSTITLDDVKRDPAGFVALVERGEPVTLVRDNRPVAEVTPVAPEPPKEPRPIGLCKGQFVVPDDFDDPLPDDILNAFYGEEGTAIRILYGGSVKPANAGELLAADEVGGALVGGASLTAESFLGIVAAAHEALEA